MRKPVHPEDFVARGKKLVNRAEPGQTPQPKNADVVSPLSRFFEGAAETFAKPSPPPAPIMVPQLATPQVPSNSTGLRPSAGNAQDLQKLRIEVKRLESLVKKLQNDLVSEREYCATLESQLQALSIVE